uniref:MADS-box domain-containing protein n=1 Tax=Kalanchoe fedtschenkoi TaxID=63787 RepID=A0A7N0U8V8_KALFE
MRTRWIGEGRLRKRDVSSARVSLFVKMQQKTMRRKTSVVGAESLTNQRVKRVKRAKHKFLLHQPTMKGGKQMGLIEDLGGRKVTYKKRRETLVKKMEEITTLSGLQACLVIFSEFEEGGRAVVL